MNTKEEHEAGKETIISAGRDNCSDSCCPDIRGDVLLRFYTSSEAEGGRGGAGDGRAF